MIKILNKIGEKIQSSLLISDGLFNAAKFFMLWIFFFMIGKLHVKNKYLFKLRFKKFNKIFTCYLSDNSDLAILTEIFIKDEYNLNLQDIPTTILDVGSNVGLSVVYFKLKYPNATIYAFEPDPETFKKLQKNTSQFSGIHCFNLAVSDLDGHERFYLYPESSMSSSLIKRVDNQDCLDIESIKLDTFISKFDIKSVDLMKVDIEGAEYRVFNNFKNLNMVKTIIGEMHLDLMGETKEDFLSIFSSRDVSLKEISKQRFIFESNKK